MTGRSRAGVTTKRHVVVDGNGIPLAMKLSAGHRHEMTMARQTIQEICVPRPVGRPRTRPDGLAADKGYDADWFRSWLRRRGIRSSIPLRSSRKARPGRPVLHDKKLSGRRWVVERTFGWLNNWRGISVRYARRSCIYMGSMTLAAILICLNALLK
jgi:transposase